MKFLIGKINTLLVKLGIKSQESQDLSSALSTRFIWPIGNAPIQIRTKNCSIWIDTNPRKLRIFPRFCFIHREYTTYDLYQFDWLLVNIQGDSLAKFNFRGQPYFSTCDTCKKNYIYNNDCKNRGCCYVASD